MYRPRHKSNSWHRCCA